MVLKGAKARKEKKLKLVGRPERSLFVKIRNKVERERIVEILKEAHSEIDHVFLPRQKIPKGVYVLLKNAEERDTVKTFLRSFENEELGRLYVSDPKPRQEKSKSELSKKKNVKGQIDRCCLLLEFVPKEVTDAVLEEEFPEAEKITRFNKRRCYILFKKPKDAMKARIRISQEKIAGHDLKVKFNKIRPKVTEDSTDEES